jgi:bifunctional pyridoxal-dependent enzyme with beta-cystathionase and maltose regulon repressor activities
MVSRSRAITPRAKIIIVNTPHNPVGKVFTREELEGIAAVAEEHNLLIISDEVASVSENQMLQSAQYLSSMIVWCMITKSMCALPHCLVCGIGQSQ